MLIFCFGLDSAGYATAPPSGGSDTHGFSPLSLTTTDPLSLVQSQSVSGSPTPIHVGQQVAELINGKVDDIPCCPLVIPLTLDASMAAQRSSPMTPPLVQDAHSIVLQQPFVLMSGAKPPSLPQSPAPSQHHLTSGDSDTEGRTRVGFVGSTIKTLDEKLRNLLYQEYAPMYPAGGMSDTQSSGTEYVQFPLGPESATGGSGNSTPKIIGEGRMRPGEQLVSLCRNSFFMSIIFLLFSCVVRVALGAGLTTGT